MKINNKKLKESDYVPIEVYYKNHIAMNNRIYNGWEFIHETSKIKMITGGILMGIGIITLPVPCGSIPLIIFGGSLMGIGGIDYLALKNTVYWRVLTRLKMRRNR